MKRFPVALAVASAISLAACSTVVYRPAPQGAAGLTVSEARRSLAEALRVARAGGRPCSEVRVADEGFEVACPWKAGPRTRSHRFAELPDLPVVQSGDEFRVDLAADGSETVSWASAGEARRFVDAAHALRELRSAAPAASDNAAFAEFAARAAEWRALRPKPALPEGARRYKTLAEEASANRDLDGAASFYEQALAIQPLWPEGQYNAALLYGELGIHAKAIAHMKRYLELVPGAPDAAAGRSRLAAWEKAAADAR
jgi:tetratricopeptide (TPR) repeat protein